MAEQYEPVVLEPNTEETSTVGIPEEGSQRTINVRRGRVWVAVATSTLLLAVGLAVVALSKNSNLRSSSQKGLSNTISEFAVCTTNAPSKIALKIDASNVEGCDEMPTEAEGIWTYMGFSERDGMEAAKYTMMPARKLYMYLDACVPDSALGAGNDHCRRSWLIQDPTKFAKINWGAMNWKGSALSVMHTNLCDRGIPGDKKPIAPPIGLSTWRVNCGKEIWKDIPIMLEESGVAKVYGKWMLETCAAIGGSIKKTINLDITPAGSTKLANKEAVKGEILHQVRIGHVNVSTASIPASMVSVMNTQFENALKFTHEGAQDLLLSPPGNDVCYWTWQWQVFGAGIGGDINVDFTLLSQSAHAWTSSSAMEPKCLPGFATDFPRYQVCDAPDHAIPKVEGIITK